MNLIRHNVYYRKFLLDSFVSTLGDSLYYLALITYASQLPRPSLAIMLVTLSETLPRIFSVLTGSLADLSLSRTQKSMLMGLVRAGLYGLVGVLIGWQPSLLLLSGIAMLNFISDIVGNYSSSLMAPFIVYLVKEEELETAQGLTGAVRQTVSLLAQFIAAFLMGIFSYRFLAWLNSLMFLLSVLIIFSMAQYLLGIESKELAPSQQLPVFSLRQIGKQIKLALTAIATEPAVLQPTILFALANGGLAVLSPLLSLLLVAQPDLIISSFSFTFAIFQGILGLSMIGGNLVGPVIFQRWQLKWLCQTIFLALMLTAGAYLSTQAFFIGLSLGLVGFLIGAAAPKLNALLVRSFPVQQLASVGGGINTLLSVTPVVTSLFFMTVAGVNLRLALVLLLLFSCGALLSTLLLTKKVTSKEKQRV